MENQKHVLIVTPGFPRDENDSANVPYLQDYIFALKEKIGAEKIKIISIHFPFQTSTYLWNEIEVFPIGGKNKKGIFKIITWISAIRKVKLILKLKPYVLHSFWFTDATLISYFANRKKHTPHICTLMGQDVKKANRLLKILNLNHITTVTVSENQNNIFFDTTGRRSNYVIPLPIPKIIYQNQNKDIDLLFVSSFISLKHPELFISLVKKLHQDFPQIKTAMIGTGYLLNHMYQFIHQEKLDNVIALLGKQERPEVFKSMHRSKILVHPSEFEGQCLVYAEALAHGMHVVSSPVGRIEETEKHHVCASPESFYLQCKTLLQSTLNFDPYISLNTNEIVEQYLSIYQNE